MDIEMKLKDVVEGDLETALSAIQFFDEYLKGLSEVDDSLVHSLINGLAHRVWMVRSQLFDLFLKHQNKIYPFLSEYLTSDNEDIQYWGIQIYCSVAKKERNIMNELPKKRMKRSVETTRNLWNVM